VQSIIVIDAEHKAGQESLSKVVCKRIYETLVTGGNLNEVYKVALQAVKKRDKLLHPCCCCHPHKPDCDWAKTLFSQGPQKVVNCLNSRPTSCILSTANVAQR
jgi:hypothetical protein